MHVYLLILHVKRRFVFNNGASHCGSARKNSDDGATVRHAAVQKFCAFCDFKRRADVVEFRQVELSVFFKKAIVAATF